MLIEGPLEAETTYGALERLSKFFGGYLIQVHENKDSHIIIFSTHFAQSQLQHVHVKSNPLQLTTVLTLAAQLCVTTQFYAIS